MKAVIFALAFSAALLPGATEDGELRWWSAQQLQQRQTDLGANEKGGFETLADFGTHNIMLAVRHGDGQAELHEKMADVFVIRSGKATLVTGGEMIDGKTTAPGELRGSGIRGGARQPLGVGDVVHIPAGLPHQILMKSGDTFSYLVVKAIKE